MSRCWRITRTRSTRRAFTLIELLVVMLIIAILMGLLIPAVNAARESARATQSRNNLKQMALAMHQYNSAKTSYPPSYMTMEYNSGNPTDGSLRTYSTYNHLEGWSVHTLLLPYLEQKLVAEEIDYSKPYNYYVADTADNPAGAAPPLFTLADLSTVRLGTMRVPTYVSPAEPRDEIREGKHYPCNYAMNLGTWFVWDPLTGQGGNGSAYPNSKLRDGQFTDGLSTTLAFAEVKSWQPYFRDSRILAVDLAGSTPPATPLALATLIAAAPVTTPEYKETNHTEWFNGHAHHSGFTTVFAPNTKVMVANRTGSSAATINTTATGNADIDWTNKQEGKNHFATTAQTEPTYAAITARSYFAGGVNVAMMDGSVRNVENNINLGVWRAISTRSGKEKVPNNFGQQ